MACTTSFLAEQGKVGPGMPRSENERLKTFIEVVCRQFGRSIAQLAKEMHRSRDTLVGWLDNTRIPAEAIGFFSSNYGLQLEWFYHGRGPMLLDAGGTPRNEHGEAVRSGEPRSPYHGGEQSPRPTQAQGYPVPVMAVVGNGDTGQNNRGPTLETGRFICLFRPPLPGEVAVEVVGDSMEPVFYHGDIITCRPIPFNDLRDGEDYVVMTDRGLLLRQVVQEPDANPLLKTRNPAHPDELRPAHVFACYEMVMHIHAYRRPGANTEGR
ncbi:MAG: hypothetical protein GF331_14475 [Chitinivibrionales bacterium]|nr:hypothetical protein [Chitinivibrionales bacterium]